MKTDRHPLFRPLIFGLADGAMSIVGIVLYAAGHGDQVFLIALAGGLSAALSMGGSEWLSNSDNGFMASLAMGASTLLGSIVPAVPYTFLHGNAAPGVSLGLLGIVAYFVGRMRKRDRKHPYLEAIGILSVILIASIVFSVFI